MRARCRAEKEEKAVSKKKPAKKKRKRNPRKKSGRALPVSALQVDGNLWKNNRAYG